ncbi:BTAD domain-containing putative transcriptional regulator [Kitasatospora sp. NPDC018619]|uniref:AfsR/SARP family transcriptional regulator n=1 Tax=unclassified Kitasatospora TaxID=2633591 RepID=UPI0037AE2B87
MENGLQFRVLGPLEVLYDSRPVAIGGPRHRTVLAMLLLAPDRIVPVDSLIEALWNGSPPTTGQNQVAICISGLRKAFKTAGCTAEVISTVHPGYRLVTTGHEIDAQRFTALMLNACEAVRDGRRAEADRLYGQAHGLWRGDAYAGVDSPLVQSGALHLADRRLALQEEHLALRLESGQHRELIGELTALLNAAPLREQARVSLMLAQYRCGRRAEALDTFREGRRLFIEEIGLEPGPVLRELHDAILRDDAALLAPIPAVEEPAPAAAPLALVPPAQLPPDVTAFIGRGAELAVLDGVAAGGDLPRPPVALITGVPGVGKTGLAVHWAHRAVAGFPDGQLFADLQGFDEHHRPSAPTETLDRFLRALGVPSERMPAELSERVALYRSILNNRRVLIVLDNVRTFSQIRPLLPGTGSCTVLVTSREQLPELTGDYGAVRVHLTVLSAAEATTLLCRIAGPDRVGAEPDSAVKLSERCDRLPLALRIAGARLASKPHWTVLHLVTRLDDERRRLDELSRGEREIRASFALSYGYLHPGAAAMYRRLGLLGVNSFTAWIGAALLDTDPARAEDLMERLVDCQLLEVVGVDATGWTRYKFQDLLRLYALERAQAEESPAERDAACGRAFGAVLGLAEQAHRRHYGGDYTVIHGGAPRWPVAEEYAGALLRDPLAWLETERPTILATIEQAARLGWHALAWDLAMTVVTLFESRNYLDDWRRSCGLALDAARRGGDATGEAAMLYSLGVLEAFQQRYPQAGELYARALHLFGGAAETHGYALALRNLALLDRMAGDVERAMERYTTSLAGLQQVGDRYAEAHVLGNMAQLALERRSFDDSVRHSQAALAISREIGTSRGEAQSLYRLAEAYAGLERLAEAGEIFQRVLALVRQDDDGVGQAYALCGLGEVQLRAGDLFDAEATLLAAVALAEEVRDRFVTGRAGLALAQLLMAKGEAAEAERRLTAAEVLFTELGTPYWLVRARAARSDRLRPVAG